MSNILVVDDEGNARKSAFELIAEALAKQAKDTQVVFELKAPPPIPDLILDIPRGKTYPTKIQRGKFPKRFHR